jgi:hypothetical protein
VRISEGKVERKKEMRVGKKEWVRVRILEGNVERKKEMRVGKKEWV